MKKQLTIIISILIIAILLGTIICSKFYNLQENEQNKLAKLVNERKIEVEQEIERLEREIAVEQEIERLEKVIEEKEQSKVEIEENN